MDIVRQAKDPATAIVQRTGAVARRCCCGLLAIMVGGLGLTSPVFAQGLDFGFDPAPNGVTRALAEQADGKLLVAGTFTTIDGQTRNRIARLHIDGRVDAGFDAGAGAGGTGAQIRALAVQPDGHIVVGGFFTSFAGQTTLQRLVRLRPDGRIDPGFLAGSHRLQTVLAIAPLPDGRMLVGGSSIVHGQPGVGLARFNADGSVDESFDAAIAVSSGGVSVDTLAVQRDGRVLIGGNFHSVAGQPRNHLARLHPDGGLDTSFDPQANGNVHVLALQGDGRIVVGGAFTHIAGQPRGRLARLDLDGGLDLTFDPGANDAVHSLFVQADGRMLAGGDFTQIAGQPRNRVARLRFDGSLDDALAVPSLVDGSSVRAVIKQSDGRVVAASMAPVGVQHRLLRFNIDGTLDNGLFEANSNGTVLTTAIQHDGKIVVGGEFFQIGGMFVVRNGIARLHGDGAVDTAFNAQANGPVRALAVDGHGRIVVGGDFTSIGGFPMNHLARLTAAGALDTSFNPAPNGIVRSLAIQADGRILIGGSFTTLSGQSRERLARLNDDGSLDPSFPAQADNIVTGFTIQPDARILVVGWFETIAGQPRSLLARLMPDGSLDPGFTGNPNGQVNVLALQADGRMVIGGNFDAVDGQVRHRLARLHPDGSLDADFAAAANGPVLSLALQADGGLVAGGAFTQVDSYPRERLVRLLADGTVDPDFAIHADSLVTSVGLQTDGRILVGGAFRNIGFLGLDRLARISIRDAAMQSLTVDGSTVRWRRVGPGPELNAAPMLLGSSNGVSFQSVAHFVRSDDGWQATGIAPPPAGQVHWLRTHGVTAAGFFNGSGGALASTLLVHGGDRLFANGFD